MPSCSFGSVQLPLSDDARTSLLRDADPALFLALDYLRAAIETGVGARLLAQAHAAAVPMKRAIAMALPFDPGPYLTEAQVGFPLFALFRKEETALERTFQWRELEAEWGFGYVLPTLTAGGARDALRVDLEALAAALVQPDIATLRAYVDAVKQSLRSYGKTAPSAEEPELEGFDLALDIVSEGLPRPSGQPEKR